jgi:hypothetical protein
VNEASRPIHLGHVAPHVVEGHKSTGTSVVTGTSAAPAAGADGEGALSSAVTDLTAQLGAASNSASTAAEHAAAAAAASAFASQAAVAAVAAVTAEEP